jgi:hypothetical protein
LWERYDVHAIACDAYGGNLATVKTLEDAGLQVRALSGAEHVAACGKLVDLVRDSGFRHIGQPELAHGCARQRPSRSAIAGRGVGRRRRVTSRPSSR